MKYLLPFLLCITGSPLSGQDAIPPLNQAILSYVDSVMGKQVDRGECWDLAYEALERNHARWDGKFKFGKPVNPAAEKVYPGDIVQFEKVNVQYSFRDQTILESYQHHTAVIYKVYDKGLFDLAHQNTAFSGKKVGISTLDLRNVTKGRVYIYRPLPE